MLIGLNVCVIQASVGAFLIYTKKQFGLVATTQITSHFCIKEIKISQQNHEIVSLPLREPARAISEVGIWI